MYGFGQGRGFGRGFGFRGFSPPWPYIGRGRGGLPRCGWFLGWKSYWPQGGRPWDWPQSPAYPPFISNMTREQEIEYLRREAEAVKQHLDRVEARIRDLESEQGDK